MTKRSLDEVFGSLGAKKRSNPLYGLKQEFAQLLGEKKEFVNSQRRASLLVPPFEIDSQKIQKKFSGLFDKLTNVASLDSMSNEYKELATQLVQESVIMEWPKSIQLDAPDTMSRPSTVEADMAPLIHRARNVVKCRTSHPTMRIKVCAIGPSQEGSVIGAAFRATLVKMAQDSHELRQVAGKLILTQREGTPSAKNHEQHGVSVTNDGRLVVGQIADAEDILGKQALEQYEATRSIPLQFHDEILSASFPEMGVMLNSMIDRRQLNTRYAIQVEVTLRLANGFSIDHTLLSHPFLIAITNDQTEPLLLSIFWQRLLDEHQIECNTSQEGEETVAVKWGILKEAIKYFMKAQIPNARSLTDAELLHVQCMLFLTMASNENPRNVEEQLFGNVDNGHSDLGILSLRNRLLTEFVRDDILVLRKNFMQDKCTSIVDCHTLLDHSIWHWLFKSTEMIIDVGHKLCPAPIYQEKKGVKPKKPSSSSYTEVCTMLNLFNRRILSLIGSQQASSWFQTLLSQEPIQRVMLLRFCDENLGSLSIMASNVERPGLPFMGPLSSEKIRDLKQGLSEAIMDEPFPKQYDKLLVLENDNKCGPIFNTEKKSHIFSQYQTLRLRNETKNISSPFTVRIEPLSGERFDLSEPPSSTSSANAVLLEGLPNLTPMNGVQRQEIPIEVPDISHLLMATPSSNLEAMIMQNFISMFQNQEESALVNNALQDLVHAPKNINEMLMLMSNQITDVPNTVNTKLQNKRKSKQK